jgi:hypothetical protein
MSKKGERIGVTGRRRTMLELKQLVCYHMSDEVVVDLIYWMRENSEDFRKSLEGLIMASKGTDWWSRLESK